jgi:2-dehydropantoate 2-reductase
MTMERVCVVGAGAIGSLFAGHLASVAEVSVLCRREEHAAALSDEGLRVSGKSERHARVAAATDPRSLPVPDLVIVAVKATQLEATASVVRGCWPGAAAMTVQNGLGAEAVMHAAGDWPLISSVTFMSGIRHGDAHVEYELDTPTWLGPWSGTETPLPLAEAAGDLIARSGLKVEVLPDLLPAQWSKLIFNAAVNGVAALTELPHVALFAAEDADSDLGHVLRGLVDEGKAVAAAAGVALHDDPWEMNVRAVSRGSTEAAGGDYAHLPSMLEDVLARRPTETDWIGGALVREAARLGVPVPLNAAVWRLVKAKEASWARGAEVAASEAVTSAIGSDGYGAGREGREAE